MVRKEKIHVCVDCAKLPADQQPHTPRPAPHGGPRSKRCTTHQRLVAKVRKIAAHAARGERVYGMTKENQAALWDFQGRRCPCGRQPTRMPDHDHDHRLARHHDHPDNEACVDCMRGLTCRACNTYVLAWYNSTQLRALADYLDDPPWPRLRQFREGNGNA